MHPARKVKRRENENRQSVPLCRSLRPDCSAVQAVFLALHVVDDDVVNVAQARAVFEHLPGRVRVEVDLDEVLIADGQQAVARDILLDIVMNGVLVEAVSFDEQLGVKTEFEHDLFLLIHRA